MNQQPKRLLPIIELLEEAVPDPGTGLPEELFLFITRMTPMVNVDLLIRNSGNETLLTWRDDGYEYSPGWHIPGGIIRFKETSAERIAEVARKELGSEVTFRPEPLVIREIIHPARHTRGHFVSMLFLCELRAPLDEARRFDGVAPKAGQWAWHRTSPSNLISVHDPYRPFIDGSLPPFTLTTR